MKKNLDKVETLHNEGFCYIGVLFHNYFTITGIKKIVLYTEDCVIKWLITISGLHCITKPREDEQILPIPLPYVVLRFYPHHELTV